MDDNPIEGLMYTAMDSLKDMIDVNTIIGEPIEMKNGFTIVPVSKVSFGFAAGGSEFNAETMNAYNKKAGEEDIKFRLPFGGGSGAGVNIVPIGFIVAGVEGSESPKFVPVAHACTIDKLLDCVPDFIEKASKTIENFCMKNNNEDSERNSKNKRGRNKVKYTKDDEKDEDDIETEEFDDEEIIVDEE